MSLKTTVKPTYRPLAHDVTPSSWVRTVTQIHSDQPMALKPKINTNIFRPIIVSAIFVWAFVQTLLIAMWCTCKRSIVFNVCPGVQFQDRMMEFAPQKFRNLVEKNCEGKRLLVWKVSFCCFFRNFCFYETKLPISEKIADFRVTMDCFLLSVVISYCRSEVIVFRFLTGIDEVRSENSELSSGISRILPVFGEIIVYLCKMTVDLKNINGRFQSWRHYCHFANHTGSKGYHIWPRSIIFYIPCKDDFSIPLLSIYNMYMYFKKFTVGAPKHNSISFILSHFESLTTF